MAIRTQDYITFSKKIRKIVYKNRFPIRTTFELTYRCNFKCVHCYIPDGQKKTLPRDELKTEDVFKILNQLKNIGCFYLVFSGGEIFLREDILDILRYATRKGFETILLTNASFINGKMAGELKRLRIYKVEISIHAIDKDIFDKITQISGSYEKVFRAIKLLRKRGILVGLKTCGMRENKEQIVGIIRFARSIGIPYSFSDGLMLRRDRSRSPRKHSISYEDAYFLRRQCYPESFAKFDQSDCPVNKVKRRNLNKLFNCGAGYTDLAISPFGELKICLGINYLKYKILEGSLKEGWKEIKDFVDTLKPPENWACRTCELIKYCSWCPLRSWLENGDFSSCDSYSREKAEFTKQVYEQSEDMNSLFSERNPLSNHTE